MFAIVVLGGSNRVTPNERDEVGERSFVVAASNFFIFADVKVK
ncbi:hypothetical protein [Microvirga subterranea]|nr:hypothetical protein [Microvirga subterranea]